MTEVNDKTEIAAKTADERLRFDKNITKAVYVLQAASFLFGITLIVAVFVNYIKKGDVKGTWLASHFKWQIRTFWFCALLAVLGLFTYRAGIGVIILSGDMIWFLYRIIKGWLYLADGKELYRERNPEGLSR